MVTRITYRLIINGKTRIRKLQIRCPHKASEYVASLMLKGINVSISYTPSR